MDYTEQPHANQDSLTATRDAALTYLHEGWSVIPVGRDKHPLISWKEYQQRLPTENEILSWWQKYPDANVGIVTGKLSGIVVVDIDPKNGGTIEGMELPATLISKTGGGGWHYIYLYPGEGDITNVSGIHPGVDIRGEGGFIVAPPSLHKSGELYEWAPEFDPGLIADCPTWLIERDLKKSRVYDLLDGVPVGQRNDAAARVCGLILSALPIEEFETNGWARIRAWNMKNDPPLSDEELAGVFHSIAKAEQQQRNEEIESEDERKSQSSSIIELIESKNIELFHSDLQEPYARVEIDGHFEIQKLDSQAFKRYLSKLYWDEEELAIGTNVIKNVLNVLEAKAIHEGKEFTLWNRVAWHEGAIWYDLSDKNHRAVRITADGWEVVEHPPILFQRYSHHKPQVLPIKGGDPRAFLDYFRSSDQGSKLLLLVTTISHLIPDIPHVVLMVHGSHGSAKTTSLRFVKRIVDPSQVETIGPMGDDKEFAQVLSHNYFVVLDNLSKLSESLSDTLCRAVTGHAGFKRILFTTDDDYIYRFKRCIGLNGITAVAKKPDLLQRSIHIALERIPDDERREESDLWPAFEAALPSILGGMFDALSRAMASKPDIRLKNNFRMADFTTWGCAITEALGINRQKFFDAYADNIGTQNEEIVVEEPVALAVIAFAKQRQEWKGTAAELLALLNHQTEQDNIERLFSWPKKPNKLSQKLTELAPTLATAGAYVKKIGRRTYRIKYMDHRGTRDDRDDQDDTFSAFADEGSPDVDGNVGFMEAALPLALEDKDTAHVTGSPSRVENPSSQSSVSSQGEEIIEAPKGETPLPSIPF